MIIVVKAGKWIAKHRFIILLLGILLLIPSFIGMAKTRINYDLLSYLPESLETVEGQDVMVDEYGMGAFAMVVVEDTDMKDIQKLADQFNKVDHVEKVLWYGDVADLSLPVEMIPSDLRKAFYNGDATLMLALFDNTTSSDEAMNAVGEMRKIASKQCFIAGMTGVVADIKNVAMKEVPIYVVIAAILSFLVLEITGESFLVPIFFLISIGAAIVYNLGSNIFLGEICYVTKALTAVLQLGVTMDYSIFLLNSYEENKRRFPGDKNRAMGHAISNTFKSIVGSSVTTVAGFVALCVMTFALGRDLGIVMAKGVIFGVLVCVTVLPSMILCCDKLIEKTKHKPLLPDIGRISDKVTKRYVIYVVAFVILLFPAIYGNNHTGVYYNLDESLPKDLPSVIANTKLKEDYNMNTTHMILVDSSVAGSDVKKMSQEIEKVDGVKWVLGLDNLVGSGVPADMLPESVTGMLKNDKYQLLMVNSTYKVATDKVNKQIEQIDKIMDKYDKGAMLVGEGPLTKDLINITDTDFKRVSAVSIGIVFVIILLLFKSVTIPVILVGVIEFAIFVNMGIPFYTGTKLPFVASIVIGTIQLGATVDYAILMTTRYQRERSRGAGKFDAITTAHKFSAQSIIVSALSFFAATIGVGLYSNIDMISSLCILMARGALISMVVVVLILPSLFMVFDKIIVKTSKGFRPSGLKS